MVNINMIFMANCSILIVFVKLKLACIQNSHPGLLQGTISHQVLFLYINHISNRILAAHEELNVSCEMLLQLLYGFVWIWILYPTDFGDPMTFHLVTPVLLDKYCVATESTIYIQVCWSGILNGCFYTVNLTEMHQGMS